MKTQTMIAKIAAVAAVSLGISAFADTYTDANGLVWTYTVLDSTANTVLLGTSTSSDSQCIDKDAVFTADVIPWTFTNNDVDYTVVEVGAGAFKNCKNMTGTLTIPDSVTNIYRAAFCYCSNITEIAFNSNIKLINGNAFGYGNYGCLNAKVTNFDLSGLKTLPTGNSGAFSAVSRMTWTEGESGSATERGLHYDTPVLLKLGPSITTIGESFAGCKIAMDVLVPTNVMSVAAKAFNNSKIINFFMPGPATGTATISQSEQFNYCSYMELAFLGPNVTAANSTANSSMFKNQSANKIYTDSGKCKIYAPYSNWSHVTAWDQASNALVDPVLYGPGREIDFAIDGDVTTLTATPTTEAALVDILEQAPIFKNHFNIDTKICVTNAISLSATPLVTQELIENASVTFDSLTFAVKTQTELDYILDVVPESVTLVLDPTGATESLTVPLAETARKVYMLLPPGASYERKKTGLIIIVK